MEDASRWKTFVETGKVVDYLSYKGVATLPSNSETGENAFESVSNSDGDDLVGGADR